MTSPATEAASLLDRLTGSGVALETDGDRLRFDGPDSVLTDDVVDLIARHKRELVGMLTGGAASRPRPVLWQCSGRYCLSWREAGWWRSIHGVVLCRSCVPPRLTHLVAATGTIHDDPYSTS